ncbi:threonylcarbamoyl-AMP synthase [Aureimonas endophytica]|uniref:Threonylcarbamoyl-AMP synthase n=1 Tax=Aureimonas endophytica TaxID=2027858 RepID=A0A916ZUC7_9HYPH|nr:L-threonylcarbamoyladenylate synthase [Aureimonas endophytica]GGE14614.1 threonylcarbamoyl-AMP synthase [Aureimonas endophytica]
MSRILPIEDETAIDEAVRLLGEGRLVALPTETVYGLAADATSGAAVAAIYAAKGRPRFNPLIAHVADLAMAERHGRLDPLARRLAERFWPGPLTLVVPAREASGIHPLVQAGLPTLALRMPRGAARDVVARLGRPVAAPSANRSGKVSPTTAAHVARSLGPRVDLVLDAGAAPVGVESTILKVEEGRLILLRPGGLAAAEVEAFAGLAVEGPGAGRIEAPGQLRSHYAPHGAVRLDISDVEPGEWLVRFGEAPVPGEAAAAGTRQLSRSRDLGEAAANLFAILAELDRPDVARIAVMPIPEEGLGAAINDRLRRAAAPRGDDRDEAFGD